jgi:hypothetical protein
MFFSSVLPCFAPPNFFIHRERFLFFFEKVSQTRKSWVDFLLNAAARSFVQVFTALGTKSLAILVA